MKYFKICSFLFAGLIALSFLLSFDKVFAEAGIYDEDGNLISHITTDTVWTKDNSPYVIYDGISIEVGATLTIESGSVLKFDNWNYLDIYGKLIVNGTASDKVYFTSLYNNDDSVGGDTDLDGGEYSPEDNLWGGFEVHEGGNYEINNAEISYADYILSAQSGNGFFNGVNAFNCENGILLFSSNIDIVNSTFADISKDFIEAYSTSTASFTSSSLRDIGENAFNIIFGSTLKLSNSTLANIKGGQIFEIFNNSSADIDGLSIKGFDGNYILELFNNSSVNIINSIIEDSFVYDAFEVFNNSHLTFKNSTLKNTFGGPAISFFDGWNSSGSTLDIIDSIIDGGTDVGLEIFSETTTNIKNTKIINFLSDGIQSFSNPTIRISDSEISGNENGIQSWGADIEIKNSVIKDNIVFGVYNNPNTLSIKAVGNWWGDASGPYNELTNASGTAGVVSGNVLYSPWLLSDPKAENDCCSNVVFIPGLKGSRLYKEGLISENQLWEPNRNADVEKLFMDSNGNSLDQTIYARDVIERTNIGLGVFDKDIYKKFFDTMNTFVNEKKINGWQALPYDWRLDINKVVKDGVKLEDGKVLNFVDEIIKNANSSKTGKVTIITHSNGGLVSKVLIDELKARGKENLIDKLILVASPQLGTPEAIVGLLHGDGSDLAKGIILNKSTARTMGENMMGAYNLLPEDGYFFDVASPIIKFDSSVSKVNYPTRQSSNFRTKYGDVIDSAGELRDFLLGNDGRSEPEDTDTNTPNVLKANLLNLAQSNHNIIDSWTAPANIKVIQLAGWGVNTVSGIEYFGKDTCAPGFQSCVPAVSLDRRPIYTEDGDKTVVTPSAVAMSGEEKYYLDLKTLNKLYKDVNLTHGNIFEATSTTQFITNFVLNEYQDISEYITIEKPISTDKTLELALHSPVSINVYDSEGNHTGLVDNPNPNSDFQIVEENILGSRYDDFGEGKYVLLDGDNDYKISLQGLDFGTFTLETTKRHGGILVATSSFVDIPTSPKMTGEVIVSTATTSPTIKIDADGDGKNDFTISGNQDFDPIVYLQILRKTVETLSASKKTKDTVIKKIDSIIKSLQKNKTKVAILKIKTFSKNLSIKTKDRLEKENKKHIFERFWKNRKHQLNKDDAEAILAMLNQLLDNLMK
jgi:hypothetical protein